MTCSLCKNCTIYRRGCQRSHWEDLPWDFCSLTPIPVDFRLDTETWQEERVMSSLPFSRYCSKVTGGYNFTLLPLRKPVNSTISCCKNTTNDYRNVLELGGGELRGCEAAMSPRRGVMWHLHRLLTRGRKRWMAIIQLSLWRWLCVVSEPYSSVMQFKPEWSWVAYTGY